MAIITVDTDGVSGNYSNINAALGALPSPFTEDMTITLAASTTIKDTVDASGHIVSTTASYRLFIVGSPAYVYSPANESKLQFTRIGTEQSNITIDSVNFEKPSMTASYQNLLAFDTIRLGSLVVKNCLFESVLGITSRERMLQLLTSSAHSATCAVINNVFIARSSAESTASACIYHGSDRPAYVYNNTITGYKPNFTSTINSIYLNNIINTTVNGDSVGVASDYNMFSGAFDYGGVNDEQSQSFTFVGSDDYHLQESDTGARGKGTNLSGDANFPFNYDKDGTIRSAWDAGAYEYVVTIRLEVDPGTFTLVGQNISLLVNRKILVEPGTFGLTGQDVNLIKNSTFYCDLTLSADGTGTIVDPWQWTQAINIANVVAGDIINLRGSTDIYANIKVITNANGTVGNPVKYQQWEGETQAQFKEFSVDKTGDAYYSFEGIIFDAGEGTASLTAFELHNVGSGEVSFTDCSFLGFRSSSYSGGDFYPYYLGDTAATWSGIYTLDIRYCVGITLTLTGCTFNHGYRQLRVFNVGTGSITVSDCTFNRVGEDNLNIVNGNNVLVTGCTFGVVAPASAQYATWYWAGTATGVWTGHEGETITQDTGTGTGYEGSGIYVGQDSGRIYLIVDDKDYVPSRSDQEVWRLDSDPTNIYFTPSTSGDNSHNDSCSFENTADNIVVEKCYFKGEPSYEVNLETRYVQYGQALKFQGDDDITNSVFKNNIIDKWESGTYALFVDGTDNLQIINNTIIAISNPLHGLRLAAGTATLANNILSGGILGTAVVTADYNIYSTSTSPYGTEANSLYNQDFNNIPIGNTRYFTDYDSGDYSTFKLDSPCVDIGSSAYSSIVPDDYIGTTRPQGSAYDIGAYEYILLRIIAEPGTFGLTGQNINLSYGYILSCDPGSYSLTGSDISLILRGFRPEIVPTSGQITLELPTSAAITHNITTSGDLG